MFFYFDESGGFETQPQGHRAGIVVGVVLPESTRDNVFGRFQKFLATLSPNEYDRGEPKGARLSDDSRSRFSKLLADCQDLLLAVTMLDLTPLAQLDAKTLCESIVKRLNWWAGQCRYQTLRDEVTLLAKQAGNLSVPQTLRLAATARCIMRALDHAVIRFAGDCYRPCWNAISFELDAVQTRPGSREQQVFETLLPAWITAWSIKNPITLVEELHTPDHPFVKQYDRANGIDLGAILRNNVHWRSSAGNPGIQIADMAATVVSRAVHGITTGRELKDYGTLMKRALVSRADIGILSVTETSEEDIARRYAGLLGAVHAVRRHER
ncbi:MAG: DUF3800 domain-containing protein [Thermoguttaceae bacterium]|jgi:hypothetical protein